MKKIMNILKKIDDLLLKFGNKIFKEFGAYRVDRSMLKKMSDYDYKKIHTVYLLSKNSWLFNRRVKIK